MRSIVLSLTSGKSVNWTEKVKEGTELADDFLDYKECPELHSEAQREESKSSEPEEARTGILQRRRERRERRGKRTA
jgi:hypothetical protein